MRTGISISPEKDFLDALEEVPEEFDFVETSIGEMENSLDSMDPENWKSELEARDLGLVIHLPFRQPLATTVEEYNRAKLDYTEKMLDTAQELGAEKAVLHANTRYRQEKDEVRDAMKRQIRSVDSAAKDRGIELCVENIPFEESKAAGLMEFGELVENTGASLCLDTGHAFVETSQEKLEKFAERFSSRISHLHVQDSHGGDDHLAVGHGEIEFDALLEKLDGFTGTATFEVFSPDYEYHSVSRRKLLED